MQMAADGTFSRRLESGRGFSEVIIRSGRCFVCGEILCVGMAGVWLEECGWIDVALSVAWGLGLGPRL